jgi:hypothetical protein
MKTPIQQLKENYYKMSESEFHYWMSQNIETLLKEERDIIMKAYNRDVINKKQNWATQPAQTSQTFYRKRIYKISPTPGQINGDTVEINAYPIGAMAMAA